MCLTGKVVARAHLTYGPMDWDSNIFMGFWMATRTNFGPPLFENTTPIDPGDTDPNYLLDRDFADNAIKYIRVYNSLASQKPFLHTTERTPPTRLIRRPKTGSQNSKENLIRAGTRFGKKHLPRQKKLGVIPQNTKLTPRMLGVPAWDSLSADQKKLYSAGNGSLCCSPIFCRLQYWPGH